MKRASFILTGILLLALLATVVPTFATNDAPTGSPQAASYQSVHATLQRFERGMMIWQSDTGLIRVILNSGYAYNYPVGVYGSLPDNSYFNPPTGRIRPINGFGRVWGNNNYIRSYLGWATSPEVGYTMTVNHVNNSVYLSLLFGEPIEIRPNSTWRYVDQMPPFSTPPTVTPPPPPPTSQPGARAEYLYITPTPAKVGGHVQLEWKVSNTQYALIEIYAHADADQPVMLLEDLATQGVSGIDLPPEVTNSVTVVLYAADRYVTPSGVVMYNRRASTRVTVPVQQHLKDVDYSQAAFQRYERGFMIWRADTGTITVFIGSGSGNEYTYLVSNYGPLPNNPYFDPPAGLVRPINGFGRVWGNYATIRDALGWATGNEEAYTVKISVNDQGRISAYTLPDGREVQVSDGRWHF